MSIFLNSFSDVIDGALMCMAGGVTHSEPKLFISHKFQRYYKVTVLYFVNYLLEYFSKDRES